MPNTWNGVYQTSQDDERTSAYFKWTIEFRKKIGEVMDDNFSINPSSCNSTAIQGDARRPLPLDGNANRGESGRVQEHDGIPCDSSYEFVVASERHGVTVIEDVWAGASCLWRYSTRVHIHNVLEEGSVRPSARGMFSTK